jgi:RNA polymerase sigma-70 factor (ECF subfamily)
VSAIASIPHRPGGPGAAGTARRAAARDAVAPALPPFWSLVEAHGSELLAHARRMTGQDAEDVVQDALLRALRAYPGLTHAEHLRAWLFRVTTTAAIDHLRRRRRELPTAEPPEQPVTPTYDDGAFEALLEPHSGPARAALRLRFVEDLDYEAIAVRLDCTAAAARQRVSTAVRALRAQGAPR